jgi:propanediol dehydratase small subunit
MYFAQIFERAKALDRKPKERILEIHLYIEDRQFYRTMRELLLLTDYDSLNPSQSFGMNGE